MEEKAQGNRNVLIEMLRSKNKPEEKLINLVTPARDLLMPELRKYIKDNWSELSRRVPGWTPNQLINYWTTGCISMNTGHYESISSEVIDLQGEAFKSALIQQHLATLNPPAPAPAPVQIQAPVQAPEIVAPIPEAPNLFAALKKDGPQPILPAPATAGAAAPSTTAGTRKYNLLNIRGDLLSADFSKASQLKDLNPDEVAYFQYRFYRAKSPAATIAQTESRPTRHNPSGSRSFFSKKT
jgi:hypothetical protein